MLTPDDYMQRALAHAARGRGRTAPNPMVGAVIVRPDGVVVGQGYTQPAGGPHAEVMAIEDAGEQARGSTLYCTLEPCSHVGRTGPCVVRIVEAGIVRVVAAVEDPNPLVKGRGFAFLREHGIAVEVGLGAAEAVRLNQPFFRRMRDNRPFVILKAAVSADWGIARAPGERTALTSAAANRHAQRMRAEVDAIGVGVGTIIVDDPLLTARDVYRARPLMRVIFDRSLRTPPGAQVLSTREGGPVIIVTTAEAAANGEARQRLEARGAQIQVAPGTLRGAMNSLAAREIGSLLLEGGATVHAAAFEEDVVDFVRLYVTPATLGDTRVRFAGGRPFSPSDLVECRVTGIGPDSIIEGYVHGPD